MNTIIYEPSKRTRITEEMIQEIVENIQGKPCKKRWMKLYSMPFLAFLPTLSNHHILLGLGLLVCTTVIGLCSEDTSYIEPTRDQVKREMNRYLHSFGSPYEALDDEDIERLERKVLELLDR